MQKWKVDTQTSKQVKALVFGGIFEIERRPQKKEQRAV